MHVTESLKEILPIFMIIMCTEKNPNLAFLLRTLMCGTLNKTTNVSIGHACPHKYMLDTELTFDAQV